MIFSNPLANPPGGCHSTKNRQYSWNMAQFLIPDWEESILMMQWCSKHQSNPTSWFTDTWGHFLRSFSKSEMCFFSGFLLRSDFGLNFTLDTVQSCSVCMEMNRDSVIALLHNANIQVAPYCCLYNYRPYHSSIYHWAESSINSQCFLIKNISVWNFEIALLDLEILEKRYIMLVFSSKLRISWRKEKFGCFDEKLG